MRVLCFSLKADLLQGRRVGGGGAGQQRGDAAELFNQHHRIDRGLGRSVSPRHEGRLQTAAQACGGAVRRAGERGQTCGAAHAAGCCVLKGWMDYLSHT